MEEYPSETEDAYNWRKSVGLPRDLCQAHQTPVLTQLVFSPKGRAQ